MTGRAAALLDPFGRAGTRRARRRDLGHRDLADIVEAGGWWRLVPAIRARFDALIAATTREPQVFVGRMTVRRSAIGWIIAQACRLIGTPLTPYRGDDVPIEVAVYPGRLPGLGQGLWWERRYGFAARPTFAVRSMKLIDADAGLLECVDGGLGMELRAYEQDRTLHFVSKRYFLRLGPWRLTVPGLLTPGVAHVIHRDLGDGDFVFHIAFRHPWFGELFFQEGVFRRKGEPV